MGRLTAAGASFALAATALWVGPAAAADAGTQDRPWEATYSGRWHIDTVDPDRCRHFDDPWIVPLYTVGHGTGSHVGAITVETWDCVNVDPADVGGPGREILDGRLLITAANGDQVEGTFEGDILAPTPDLTGLLFETDIEVAGGTGRFAGATGEALEAGVVFPDGPGIPTGSIESTMHGALAYDASDTAD